ncbi:AfsR/SARP family transcriptional regulator [Actinokineospora spheciospongiae]|uniref:AfsR/SARP family transcriptional regulator n=1 Tax=Actinokineospora spheciospongiae TaxID=909613 RepID=UPI000D713D02|nr:BTAD domain-containing putative transcriptional regulator [Actinokineospora spheciospongiae]PWW64047.1 DNA-binding SARP family transcriptional activator [Actinokineospora spheciospongiae]
MPTWGALPVEFRILGPTTLVVKGKRRHLGVRKTRGALAVLLSQPNTVVSASTLVDVLWGEESGREPRHLQPVISKARNALSVCGPGVGIDTTADGYRLRIGDSLAVDLFRFRDLVNRARAARDGERLGEAAQLYAEALGLWSDRPLHELDTPRAQTMRDPLRGEQTAARVALHDIWLDLGEHDRVEESLRSALLGELDERFAAQWMRTLHQTGRTGEIVTYFRTFAHRTRLEVDAEPSARLRQLHDDLIARASAVEAQSGRGVVVGLPRAQAHFVGRGEQLRSLDHALAPNAIVAVDGPPTVGKTTLVVQWAQARRQRSPDTLILYTDLNGYSVSAPKGREDVLVEFLRELGSVDVPTSPVEQLAHLRAHIGDRRAVFILDNARSSAQAERMLDLTGSAPVVVSSRQRLNGLIVRRGARRITVPPLSDADAEELLTRRLEDRVTADPRAMRDLIRFAGGLPMALLIAAEQIAARASVSVRDLVDELRKESRLLDVGSDGPDTAGTLRTIFSWSLDALAEQPRRLLTLLGLHPRPYFSVGAAAALGDMTRAEAGDLLDRVVDAGLLDRDRAGRYRMHDLIHSFVTDRVGGPQWVDHRQTATVQLLDWYLHALGAARDLITLDAHRVPPVGPREPIEPVVHGDAAEALRWSVTEHSNLVEATRLAARRGHHHHTWRFAASFNDLLQRHGDTRTAIEVNDLGRRAANLVREVEGEAGCLNNLGLTYLAGGDPHTAALHLTRANQLFERIGNSYGRAVSLHNLATTHLERDQLDEAAAAYRQALSTLLEPGGAPDKVSWSVAQVHLRLGDLHLRRAEYDLALAEYARARLLRVALRDERGEALVVSAVARLHLSKGNPAEAITHGGDALARHLSCVDLVSTVNTLCLLSTAHRDLGELPEAVDTARRAVSFAQDLANLRLQADALRTLGLAQARSGSPTDAATTWRRAAAILRSLSSPEAAILESWVDDLPL